MNKIWLIAQREYTTRIRKKSFLLITILGPLIMAAMMIVPLWLTMDVDEKYNVLVADSAGYYKTGFENTEHITFEKTSLSGEEAMALFVTSEYQSLIICNKEEAYYKSSAIQYYFKNYNSEAAILVEKSLQSRISELQLTFAGSPVIFAKDFELELHPISDASTGESIRQFFSFGGAVLIYFFIFLYGIQVMKAVIEEKANRIVEVMLATVRPFQLMAGKIIGIGLLGLTQFGIWLILSTSISRILGSYFQLDRFDALHIEGALEKFEPGMALDYYSLISGLQSIDLGLYLISFTIFFIGGYLIYAALFAIVGAASDIDTETQQFILPITVPLLFAFLTVQSVITNPHGQLAKVLSYIPFTSPVTMLVRLPYHQTNPSFMIDWVLSVIILIAGFVLTTWVAAKIYRVGILMYGKKVGYRELVKWFSYHN